MMQIYDEGHSFYPNTYPIAASKVSANIAGIGHEHPILELHGQDTPNWTNNWLMSTSQIEYDMDNEYPGSPLLEEDGFSQIMEEDREGLIDHEGFQVMMTTREFWEPGACGETGQDFEKFKTLSTTSSVLWTFNEHCEKSSGTLREAEVNIVTVIGHPENTPKGSSLGERGEVRTLQDSTEVLVDSTATLKLPTLDSERWELEETDENVMGYESKGLDKNNGQAHVLVSGQT